MHIIKTRHELRLLVDSYKRQDQIIGLVPTMGSLHLGHASLIQLARAQCSVVVVSIFVNPLQFAANEDLDKYPRDIPADIALCQEHGVDILYLPETQDILEDKPLSYVNISLLDQNLCGAKRPGHFKGICTIVCKLFNLVSPHKAYFGKKDIQQLRIIERMVHDLDFRVQIVGGETCRNSDGLALSSRNRYLSTKQIKTATIIAKTLKLIVQLINSGIIDSVVLIKQACQFIRQANNPEIKVDYIEIVDGQLLQAVATLKHSVIIAIALYIGSTRLIDNVIIDLD